MQMIAYFNNPKFWIIPLVLLLFVACASTTGSQIYPFTVSISEQGVKGEQDYEVKYRIFVDGEFGGETNVAPRSRKHEFTDRLPHGKHLIRIENWVKPDGEWQKAEESLFYQKYGNRWKKVSLRRATELRLRIFRNGKQIEEDLERL
jgi:hypothetical protein